MYAIKLLVNKTSLTFSSINFAPILFVSLTNLEKRSLQSSIFTFIKDLYARFLSKTDSVGILLVLTCKITSSGHVFKRVFV